MVKVNDPNWEPRLIFDAPRRWFQRKDGQVFPQPATEDWHIDRMLKDGWVEVAGPQGNAPAAPAATADDSAQKIAALEKQIALLLKEREEQAHGIQTNDVASDRPGARTDRRPGQR